MFSVLMLATTTPLLATTTPMVATSALQLQQQQKEAAKSEDDKASQSESAGPSAASASSGPSVAVSSSSGPSDVRSGAVSPESTADSQPSTKPTSNVSFIRNKVFVLAASASKSATDAQRRRLKGNQRVFISGQRLVLDDGSRASNYEPSSFQLQLQGNEDVLFTTTSSGSLDDVHVDSSSYQLLVGSREEHAHIREPMAWDLLPNEDGGLVLKARNDFLAVEEASGGWVLYFDVERDGLKNRPNAKGEAVPIDLAITAGPQPGPAAAQDDGDYM